MSNVLKVQTDLAKRVDALEKRMNKHFCRVCDKQAILVNIAPCELKDCPYDRTQARAKFPAYKSFKD